MRRAEIDTVTAGLAASPLVASRQTRHLADLLLSEVDPDTDFEIVVLPGGLEGARHLAASALVREWLFRQRQRNRWVAALCAGPTALLAHGWLKAEAKLIAHPTVQSQFPAGMVQRDQRVVVDGKLITSIAAGSAMEFALEIVRQLRGSDSVSRVNQGVLVAGLF